MTKHFNNDNFQKEVIDASKDKPVLVDFFAEWCGPCKMMSPVIDELADEMKENAIIGKLNTEESQAIAGKYNVMSIPTLIVFKDGEVKETLVGMQPKESLQATLKKY